MTTKCPHCSFNPLPEGAQACPNCGMTLSALSIPSMSGIDFSTYIAERTLDFIGREWVFKALDAWLAQPAGPRFFLLTGEAGSGKSAIAARLAQFALGQAAPPPGLPSLQPGFLSALHFCSARDLRWISPHTFAESLALQLSACYPAFGQALAEKSGDRQIRIQVMQQIGQVSGGQVNGVVINNLDVSQLSPEDAFIRVVREPLESLLRQVPGARPVILVDGLDEALQYDGQVRIVEMIAQAEHLPDGVRFIVTSSPEVDAVRPLRQLETPPVELALNQGLERIHSLDDIKRYVLNALAANSSLPGKLAPDLSLPAFVAVVVEQSEGNFLYVKNLLQMLEQQAGSITRASLEMLPQGLDGIYLGSLAQLNEGDMKTWSDTYAPLLGVLAVAQSALTEDELANFTHMKPPQVRLALKTLRRFVDVDESLPASQRVYTIYHPSFASFLLDQDRAEEYWCEAQAQNQCILDYYQQFFSGTWSGCDDYGLNAIVRHAIQAQQTGLLAQILTPAFMNARVLRAGWFMPFVLDLERAAAVASPEQVFALCTQVILGPEPNSLVNQRILHLLVKLWPKLEVAPAPNTGKPARDATLEATVRALSLPPDEAANSLATLLENVKNPRLQGVVALALGESGSLQATPALLNAFNSKENTVGWSAADALIALNDRTIIPGLVALFDDTAASDGVKQRILYVLGRLGATEARPLVARGLVYPNLRVKAQAINMIWLLAPVENSEALLWEKLGFSRDGVEHDQPPAWKSEWLQQRMVTALGRVGSPEAKPHLERFAVAVTARPAPATLELQRQRRNLLTNIQRALQDLERRQIGDQGS